MSQTYNSRQSAIGDLPNSSLMNLDVEQYEPNHSHYDTRRKIIIIGRSPPPIGGVTIHVSRLVQLLTTRLDVKFVELKPTNLPYIVALLLLPIKAPIHLHTSKASVRFLVSLAGRLFRKRIIITYHGDLGRFSAFGNCLDYLSIRLCTVPVVLNEGSSTIARKLNRNSCTLTAYIPPQKHEPLSDKTQEDILALKNRVTMTIATCAYALAKDNDGREIYGITELAMLFSRYPNIGFVLSDPSGQYFDHFNAMGTTQPNNVLIITGPHSFYEVLRFVDVFVRNTTTDGDSLSVREAQSLNKIVFATSVVSRPEGVELYQSVDELENRLVQIDTLTQKQTLQLDGSNLVQLYTDIYFS